MRKDANSSEMQLLDCVSVCQDTVEMEKLICGSITSVRVLQPRLQGPSSGEAREALPHPSRLNTLRMRYWWCSAVRRQGRVTCGQGVPPASLRPQHPWAQLHTDSSSSSHQSIALARVVEETAKTAEREPEQTGELDVRAQRPKGPKSKCPFIHYY